MSSQITKTAGTGITVRGNDIDTDRIIPARYMTEITFENMGKHVFADERARLKKEGGLHPFDDPKFAGAAVLVANKAFGSGSSREHAPQALMRWGIKAIVAESFAEIFFGNCTTLGIPCVTLPQADIESLMKAIESDPRREAIVDIEGRRVLCGDRIYAAAIPDGTRKALTEGTWDATGLLLAESDAIRKTMSHLPYVSGFSGA